MLKNCPDPIYVQDLQFKLRCRLKVFDNDTVDTFPNVCSLVGAASRYGLLFVGSYLPILQVIQTKYIESCSPKDKDISNYPHRTIPLSNVPLHISVNCDCTILAVVLEKDNCSTVIFYDVLSFYKQNVAIIKEIRLSATPGIFISEVGWNPVQPRVFTACKSNGSLGVYEIKGNSIDVNEIPPAAEACCFCWSPKGKRIAVGSRNGRITQYNSNLKPVAVINQPPLDRSHSLISLQWVASYQFVGIYQSIEQADQTKLIVIDAPKTGENVYINYEDICYSGSTRKAYFYMIFQKYWNILMVASSNSSELGVLGASGENWLQWILPDTGRAELPLTANHQDAFPVGVSFDTSPNKPVPWGEATISPCPYLVLLSHTGVICIFDVVNLKQGTPSVCCPPDDIIDTSGISLFTVNQPSVIEVNLGMGDPAPMPTISSIAAAAIVPQQHLPTCKPSGPTLSSFSFAQQSQTSKVEVARTSVAVAKSTAASAMPSVVSAFYSQMQPHGEQPLFGGQQTGSSLTFGHASITGDVAQTKPVTNQTAEKASMKDVTSLLLEKMIREECAYLEVQFRALLAQGRSGGRINIGDEETQLVKQVLEPQTFIDEIVEVCLAQNAEVHSLKRDLIFSWALYEDILSRYNSKDETEPLIMQSQRLDPVAERRQVETNKTLYYIESQLSQASKALDEQWNRFQDYVRRTHRTHQIPTMEAIFQTMVRQNAIIQKQMYVLKDIRSRVKCKSTVLDEPYLFLSRGNFSSLENEMEKLSIGTEAIQKNYYEKTVHRTQRFTEKKNDKLRKVLKIRSVTHVSSVQPHLLSVLDTSRAKLKSLLSTRMSPVSRENDQQFFQSTPIKKEQSLPQLLYSKPPPKQSNTPSAAATFQPLSKAVPSAFAPTAQSQSKLLNFHSQPVSVSMASSTDNSTAMFTFGSANTEKSSNVTENSSNNPKAPAVIPLKVFDTKTELLSATTFSLNTTPVASTAFSTSKPATFEGTTMFQSKAFPIMSVANTKVAEASGTASMKAAPPFTLNFGSSGTATPTSTMTPKTTAVSTTTSLLYPSLTSFGGTTPTTAAYPKTVSAADTVSVNPSHVTVSSTTVPTKSDRSDNATEPSKPATPAVSIYSTVSSTLLSGSASSPSSVLGEVRGSGTATVDADSINTRSFDTTPAATFIFGQSMPVSNDVSISTTASSIAAFRMQSSTAASSAQSAACLGSIFTTTSSVTTCASILRSTATSTTSTAALASTIVGAPVFGSSITSTAPSSTSSIFGFPVSTKSSDSVFGSSKTSSSSGGSIFGAPPTSTSSGTTFEASKTPASSVFSTTTFVSTSPSGTPAFGSAVSTTSGGGSIFRSSATSIFGSGTTSGSNIFGGITASAASMFGTKPTTTISLFDSVPASTTPSVFGGISPPANTTPSVFGGSSPVFSQPAVFDQRTSIFDSTATTQSGGSIFATTSPSQGGSIFGAKTSGGASPSLFGTGNTSSHTQSIFGSNTPAASAGGSVFGSATAAASSPFGSAPVFGGATPTGTTSPFGQGSGFGLCGLRVSSSGAGSTLNFGSTTSSPTPPANPFNSTADQKSIFGSGGTVFGNSTSIFGSVAAGGSFRQTGVSSGSAGGGPFTGGGGTSIAQTGFAAATSGASAPTFGAPPSFGGAPTFGAAPAFGSSPGFGSPQSKLFGAAVAQPQSASNIAQGGTLSGAATTGSPGFGNLANQNTIGFGNLAQQAQTPSSTPFSGNSSFSTWR